MGVVGHVEDPGAVTPGADQAGQPQFGQMLGHPGGLCPDQLRQLIDRVLPVKKGPDDAQPRLIPEQLQHAHGRAKLVLGGNLPYLAYLRSHVDIVPRFLQLFDTAGVHNAPALQGSQRREVTAGKSAGGYGVEQDMIPLSVLDLATVASGSTPAQALTDTIRMASVVEQLGYKRLWVAEHHGMPAVASSAPAVLIAHLAGATSTLRVGSGGVMLPNHSPLVVAEQFGTLEALHPGRIDLGLGRAPGTDQVTARALRRAQDMNADTFPDDVVELIRYLLPNEGPPAVPSAVPGSGYLPEVWLLGSSLFSAQLAGMLGLPFSFAYHFAPKLLDAALETYRSHFRPSILHSEPRAMVAVTVLCAPTEAEATWLSGSSALSMLHLRTGRLGLLPSPEEAEAYPFTPAELAIVEDASSSHLVGTPETVYEGLVELQRRTSADEIMVSTRMHSYEARVRSLTLVAESWGLTPPS